MPLTASDSGGERFDPVPAGVHRGICYGIFDLGTQTNTFRNKKLEVCFSWELPDVRMDIIQEDGHEVNLPRAISRIFTRSLNSRANLRKTLISWRGRDFSEEELKLFDLRKCLGAVCQVNVVHKYKNDQTYARVDSIIPLKERIKPENPLMFYCIEDDQMSLPEKMPSWLRNIIQKSDEWGILINQSAQPVNGGADAFGPTGDRYPDDTEDDDIPF